MGSMKNLIICLLVAVGSLQAQTKPATAKSATTKAAAAKPAKETSEWDELDKTFISLIQALEKGDKATFLSLSIKNVDCVDCVGSTELTKEGVFVPAEFFFAVISKDFTKSPVYQAMAKKGYSFSSVVIKGFHPSNLPKDYPNDLKLYEVWVETYKPGELNKYHKGTSHSFRFVKVNGKFRFYGLNSIP